MQLELVCAVFTDQIVDGLFSGTLRQQTSRDTVKVDIWTFDGSAYHSEIYIDSVVVIE